ncbi:MAG: Uma2 family endonuclease, partial [Candidatus Eremiobacteraeota bacterium]|nr:Uma2 family endonuclease [Candidatus Eremiobacteraeota bacterium]
MLPNGDIVGPDVAYVAREDLAVAPRSFARVVPDLAIEVTSPSDRISEVQEKLAMLRGQGVRTVALVDPDKNTMTIESEGEASRVLADGDVIEFRAVLPGWSMAV